MIEQAAPADEQDEPITIQSSIGVLIAISDEGAMSYHPIGCDKDEAARFIIAAADNLRVTAVQIAPRCAPRATQ